MLVIRFTLGLAGLVTWQAVSGAAAEPGAVRVWEEPLGIPTYAMGAPDRNPMFVQRRSYQGADAPVYPYPMWDAIADQRVDKTYRAVFLENRFVQLCVLPEIGGRVFAARDKTNGYDFLYRQHVIKPALIGMVGAWISGGIEWNIPHHHRASTFLPVDYALAQEPDGSAVVRVGELELRHRMRWVVELRLRPDSSCVEQTVRLINRTATANSFLFFANIAVHANRDYQVIFPPDTQWVTQHGKREFARWPVADSIYNGVDFRQGVDVSWWKNHPSPISMFAWGSQLDFLAGYDHGRRAGLVHVADRHVSPGKKFFTWGAGEAGQMWDRVLTDADGPYIELMAGSYSDNQPDYSWIQPYQTKIAETVWFPISQIGGVKQANRHAAVNLEVLSDREARLGVDVTTEQPDLRVSLSSAGGVLYEQKTSARPGQPFCATCRLPAAGRNPDGTESQPAAGPLTLRVLAGQRELISYTTLERTPGEPPEPVQPPASPAAIPAMDEVYQAGLRLEQLHSAALDPEDYYREVLRRDAGHVKANTALGIRAYQRCQSAEAEGFLQAAVQRVAGSYLAPRDGEPHYYLGLVLRAQHKDREAQEAFERAAWVAGWESPANFQLAEMRCAGGDLAQTLVHLERALAANAWNVKALILQAAVLRRLGRMQDAAGPLARAGELDPLDPWPAWERFLAGTGKPPQHTEDPQAILETATDYAAAGLWTDAVAVLGAAAGKAASDPQLQYFHAYYLERLDQSAEAARHYAAAAQAPPDYVFPFRREAFDVLQRARERNPRDHRAAYYLGNLYRLHGQPAKAIEQWEDARRLNPDLAVVHRNLALVYVSQPDGLPQAVASMEAAAERDPHEPRFCLELDQLYEAANVPWEQRLARLEKNQAVVAKRDDTLAREIALLVEVGQYERALALLQGHQFHIWEGAGRTAVHNSYAAAHLALGQRHFDAGRYREALQEFEAALQYPLALGTGRPLRGERLAETYYQLGRTAEALGDRDAAARHFEQAVATGPANLTPTRPGATDDPELYYFTARALERCGRAADAAGVYAGLVAAGQAQLADHLSLNFFASFGHVQSPALRAAQAHYAIGLGCLGAGKTAEARQAFEQAVKLNANHYAARKQLAAAP